jgi:hypothetical protein
MALQAGGNATKHIIMTVSKTIVVPISQSDLSSPYRATNTLDSYWVLGPIYGLKGPFLIGSRPEGAAEDRAARCCVQVWEMSNVR